jgi:hypothetical protein
MIEDCLNYTWTWTWTWTLELTISTLTNSKTKFESWDCQATAHPGQASTVSSVRKRGGVALELNDFHRWKKLRLNIVAHLSSERSYA